MYTDYTEKMHIGVSPKRSKMEPPPPPVDEAPSRSQVDEHRPAADCAPCRRRRH